MAADSGVLGGGHPITPYEPPKHGGRHLETPPTTRLYCFRCSIQLHGVVWEAVTKDGHVVIICPACTHCYSRCRQRNTKFQ